MICGPKTVLIKYNGSKISIKKKDSPEDFDKAVKLAEADDQKGIIKLFFDIDKRIKDFTDGNFTVKDKKLYLKGSDEPMPPAIVKSLIELEKSGEDYMPLIRFWRKLSTSKSENSKQQLYAFIIHNKIQLTEQGDVVLEKGVVRRIDGMPDELVDKHSGSIDHSIGAYVSMPRENVVDDRNRTCAAGLHAAPPEYVRKWYGGGNDFIIEICVHPADIISVPKDYNSQKVRCCAYRVVGYSPKEARTEQIVKLSSFIAELDITRESYGKGKKSDKFEPQKTITENDGGQIINFGGKTAKEIVKLTKKQLKVKSFGGKVPRRGAVVKKATEMFNKKGWTVIDNESETPVEDIEVKVVAKITSKVIDFNELKNLTAKEIVKKVMKDTKCEKFGGFIPRKAKVLKQAKGLYEKINWTVINFK